MAMPGYGYVTCVPTYKAGKAKGVDHGLYIGNINKGCLLTDFTEHVEDERVEHELVILIGLAITSIMKIRPLLIGLFHINIIILIMDWRA